jgi:nucleoid-associated protein YgaU
MNHLPPTLRRGSRGDAVKGLQNALGERGFHVGQIDGIFGPTTEDAVRQFQGAAGLAEDGIVGPNTWQALCVHLVQRGDTLFGIAEQRLGDGSRFPEIFELNRELVDDPDRIFPNQVLTLPEDAC